MDSSNRSVMCGVPQGSVLGSLLYVSFSNDVCNVIRACSFHMYADDLQLYHTSSIENIQRCYDYDEVNEDLKRIYDWSIANGLRLNPKKSQVIVVHRSKKPVPDPQLFVGRDAIKVVDKVMDLGFVINNKLTAVDHCNKICQK
jgi:Reverse transcriptase (RNA-dependent DNA polymerase)